MGKRNDSLFQISSNQAQPGRDSRMDRSGMRVTREREEWVLEIIILK